MEICIIVPLIGYIHNHGFKQRVKAASISVDYDIKKLLKFIKQGTIKSRLVSYNLTLII